jgi:hypothetical protein
VERIQGQIDEPICAHDEQSQGANQVDRSAHAASPVNAGVCPLPTLVGATLRYKARLGSQISEINLRTRHAQQFKLKASKSVAGRELERWNFCRPAAFRRLGPSRNSRDRLWCHPH